MCRRNSPFFGADGRPGSRGLPARTLDALVVVNRGLPGFSRVSMGESAAGIGAAGGFPGALDEGVKSSGPAAADCRLALLVADLSTDVSLRNGEALERRSRVAGFY